VPGVSPAKASGHEGGLPPVRLRRVLDHIEAHLGDDIAMDRLAEVARLSPDHFSRLFRQSMGLPPHRYVLYRRIARARQLVADSRLSLAEIGYALGFPSQAHFTTMFRRLVGTTPGTYRGMTSHGDRRSPAIAI
jgi:AraC family transcriptional regulator